MIARKPSTRNGARTGHVRLEVLGGSDCPSCDAVYQRLQRWLAARPELPVTLVRVHVLDNLDRAVALGVLHTPALVLDGKLIVQGAGLDLGKVLATVLHHADS